jgi:TonB family protein
MVTKGAITYQNNSFMELILYFWIKLITETRYRLSGSVSFSLLVHILLILGYFSISSLDQPAEPPIREISFIDLTEVEKKPEEIIKKKVSRPPIKPRIVEKQPVKQPDNAQEASSAPIALGKERIFLDSPRKQAPINIQQLEPITDNVNQMKDMLKVSPAIGVKKDNRTSKPQALDLGKNREMLIASASQTQGAVSFNQTGKPQIDLSAGRVMTEAGEAVVGDFNSTNPEPKKEEPLLKPRETQTIITGALANRKVLKKVIPPFPRWAKIQGVGATISLRFTVMENGTVKENVIIERTSGSLQWDQMVISSLKNWQFVALTKKGIREDQTGVITFQFVL